MKKFKLLIFLATTFSSLAYGSSITLDEMLKKVDSNSYEKDIYLLTEEQLEINESLIRRGDYNGLTSEITTEYNREDDRYDINGNLSYGDFYIRGEKADIKDGDQDTDSKIAFGVNKNLKDIFYSENKSDKRNLEYTRKIEKNSYLSSLETRKINLINLYEEYKSTEFEIKLKEENLISINSQKKIIEKSHNMGASTRIDLDAIKTTAENLELEIKNLLSNMERLTKIFYYDYKINISNSTLLPLEIKENNIENYLANIGKKEENTINYKKSISAENMKYEKYSSNLPDLVLGVEHIKESGTNDRENRVYLTLSKTLFDINRNIETERINIEKYEINLEEQRQKSESTKLQLLENLDAYKKDYLVNRNKADLEKNKYEIMKLEYKLGSVKYIEVIDAFNDYLDYEVASEKAKNNLNGYIYEIKVRGENNYE